jgi:hypothetical protein
MMGLAKRSVAAVAIVSMLILGAPVVALAAPTTTTTTAPVITTMKQFRAAEKIYLFKARLINRTFLADIAAAKAGLTVSLDDATNSSQRISARATYRLAITQATVDRSNSLQLLGNPPLKPHRPDSTTTTTF